MKRGRPSEYVTKDPLVKHILVKHILFAIDAYRLEDRKSVLPNKS